MRRLRIALVTHAMGPPVRGNGTTVARWVGGLLHRGHAVDMVLPGAALPAQPDIVHGYHAFHGGRWAARLAAEATCPLVVSLGGTDVHACAHELPMAAPIRDVLDRAAVVTGAFSSFAGVLDGDEPHEPRYVVVRRGVYLSATPGGERAEGPLRVLLVAGLRRIKAPLLALDLAQHLVAAGVPIHVRVLGPSLEPDYAEHVRARIQALPFASHGTRPRVAMGAVYAASDVVWNTSLHEGGANAVLEGLAHGCAVVLRDVPGNREFLEAPDAPGHLFDPRDLETFTRLHRDLLTEDADARRRRRERACAWLAAHHDPEQELDDLERAYHRALSTSASLENA